MNLAIDPWIPVLCADGQPKPISLVQALAEGSLYRDLAVRPHERVALMRLLICIAQAALDGPQDEYARDEANAGLPAAAQSYLITHQDKFELFDDARPFLQAPCITATKSAATGEDEPDEATAKTRTSKLDIVLATGAASSLFDHESLNDRRSISAAHLALSLLTYQCFSLSGTYGQVRWGTWISKQAGNAHAPCLPNSMLHSYIRQSDLAATIGANLLSKESIKNHFNQDVAACWGKPVWECMPTGIDDPAVNNATKTYLGRLVPLSRLVLLKDGSDTMLLGSMLPLPTFADEAASASTKKKGKKNPWRPPFPSETSATVVTVGGVERKLLGAGGGAPWRELAALVTSRKSGNAGGALTLDSMPDTVAFDLWVGALISDRASVIDTVESVLHVPAKMRTDNGRRVYEDEVRWAEGIGGNPGVKNGYGRLGAAVIAYRRAIDRGWDSRVDAQKEWTKKEALKRSLQARATEHFWTAVEKLRWLLMSQIEAFDTPDLPVRQATWRTAVLRAAHEAYDLACGKETARQIRAFAIGYAVLFPSPKAPTPATTKSQPAQEKVEA